MNDLRLYRGCRWTRRDSRVVCSAEVRCQTCPKLLVYSATTDPSSTRIFNDTASAVAKSGRRRMLPPAVRAHCPRPPPAGVMSRRDRKRAVMGLRTLRRKLAPKGDARRHPTSHRERRPSTLGASPLRATSAA
jgi:hypothetical protein